MVKLIRPKKFLSLPFILSLATIFTAGYWLFNTFVFTPKLVASDIDVGTFMPKMVIERIIRVENRGWASLYIYNVKTCCGATLPDGFPKKISPRTVSYIPIRLEMPVSYTPLKRIVALKTNDPKQPISKILIHGKPNTSVKITPPMVHLGYVKGGKFSDVAKIQMQNKPASSCYATSSSPHIKVLLREDTADHIISVDLELTEHMPRGKFKEYLYIKTNVSKNENLIVPISGTLERGLRPRPEKVFFGIVKEKTLVSRCIRLEIIGSGWETVKIEDIGFDGLDTKLKRESQKTFKLCICLNPLKMPPLLNCSIRLHNLYGDAVQIPVLAVHKKILKDATGQNIR